MSTGDASEDQVRVICAGHVNWDVTLAVDDLPVSDGEAHIEARSQSSGGSAANVAVGLAGLGASPVLLGSVGTDRYGALTHRDLNETAVESRLVTVDGPTTVKYLVVDRCGEVFVLGSDGANEAFEAAHLREDDFRNADHLHLTSQAPETAAALARAATDDGVSVSFDPGRRLGKRDYDDVLPNVDTLFCNDREAAIAAEADLLDPVPTVVIKRGSGGAEVRTADGTRSHAGYSVAQVDTTGAGDAFAAGFLAARGGGASLEEGLAVGNACGALATRSVGARTSLSWDEIDTLRQGP